ncbi:hypothetical protein [Pseudoalteromonas aurantia]|nr:hypothetical protein [Pseudoalteromonas aurantia]
MSNTDNSPTTQKQFVTFEYLLGFVFLATVGISAYSWNNRVNTVDKKFQQVEDRFEKIDSKLDALILSVNTVKNTMATKDDLIKLSSRVTDAEKEIARVDFRLGHLEKSN